MYCQGKFSVGELVYIHLTDFLACVLGTNMNDLVNNDFLKNHSIVRLNQVDICSAGLNGERYLILSIERRIKHLPKFLLF